VLELLQSGRFFPDISLLSCSKNRGRTSGRKVLAKFRAKF
jgi:hypothetical protein